MEERSLNQKTKQKKNDERFNKEPFIPDEMVKALMPFILQAIDDLYDEDDKGK